MMREAEVYRGIEFVRLSSLPKEQARMIRDSNYLKNTIKILHGTDLYTDCLLYASYIEWYQRYYPINWEPIPAIGEEIKSKLAF
jgi:hypothetical protein